MLRRFFDRRIWLFIAITMAQSMISIYLSAQIPACMEGINSAFQRGDGDEISRYSYLMAVYAVASFFMAAVTAAQGARLAQMISRSIRRQVFVNIHRMQRQDVDGISASSLQVRSTNDVETASNYITSMMISGFQLPFTLVIVVPAMALNSSLLITVTACILGACGGVVIWAVKRVIPYLKKTQSHYDGVSKSFTEYLEGLLVIRAYGGVKRHRDDFFDESGKLHCNDRTIQGYISFFDPLQTVLSVLLPLTIYAVSMVVLPGMPPSEQSSTYASMIVFTMYALMIVQAMSQTIKVFGIQHSRYAVSRDRIEEVLRYTPSMDEGRSDGPEHSGLVEFRNVDFTYPGSENHALRNVSFTIRPGQKVAFIGPTASGKTTILDLMSRLYDPDSGKVLLDGMDLREYTERSLRARISYATQHPMLFSGTVRDNVKYGPNGRKVPDPEVDRILDDCGCREFLDGMPEGADTELTERGKNLSGGQKQRIALARAVCSQGDVYLFDDSFSALDAITDVSVHAALDRRLHESTVVYVTQRISSVKHCDVIFVVDHGSIIASGTHESLLKDCAYYRDMVALQADREVIG